MRNVSSCWAAESKGPEALAGGLRLIERFEATSGQVQGSLPVVDNNRKVVGALSVVEEKFSKVLANFANFSQIFEQKV